MTVEFFLTKMGAEKAKEDSDKLFPTYKSLISKIQKVKIANPKQARMVGLRQVVSYQPYVTAPPPIRKGKIGYILYTKRGGLGWLKGAGLSRT